MPHKYCAPVDGALALVAQGGEAVQESLPEVLEQRPVDGLELIARRRVHRHVQLSHRLQLPGQRNQGLNLNLFSSK
jgi:hypothetical protein